MNIRGWFPLGLTGLISLQVKRLSRVFSNTTVWKHQFFGIQPSLWSSWHPSMTTGKSIALTTWTFVSKVLSLLFKTRLCLSSLQCSFLENPRDRGAWWAALYGVAQSRTRLKRLSSSSSSRCFSSSEVSFLFLVRCEFYHLWTCLVAQMVKHLPAVEDIQIWSLGQEDPLE